ncbi:dystrophin-like isoform X2 [Stylophora pistillata]|uniref:Dystrophin n=1 Tax=Stylophora pistillata TaxID=50429 RepID=A0A2B4RND4_STYPI|nr:dystrophin-like isoform X2 [Stylophora pistillata]PFX17752.1 Dystrophin [Stylophora pistillata]
MPGVTSKLPDGWERSETANGIPYYVNHETEKTQWDHPEMVSLLEETESFSNIKYAAYRTAMKLRAIQKKTQLYMVDLHVVRLSLSDEGINNGYVEGNLSVAKLSKIITAVFVNQNGDRNEFIDVSLASELTLNWILNVYDPERKGYVPILSLKVCLSIMCSEKIQEKYRYLFSQLCNNQGFLERKRLDLFLQEMLQIPKNIFEGGFFSGSSVEPAVRNCFERVSIPDRASAGEFIEWMIAEPQTIVWLPTLHRLAVSETVKHESKCNVCKMYPIVGFRYRCLKCFNFDMCQGCFWSGRVSKQHKIGHPTQEYCLVSTQKEDMKDFAKVMRNKVSKKKKRQKDPSKGRFIPIEMKDAAPSDGEDEDSVDFGTPGEVLPGSNVKERDDAVRPESHETREERNAIREKPSMTRPIVRDDEHGLIQHYAKSLTGEPESMSPGSAQVARDRDSQKKVELEHLIKSLENDNRALQGEIDSIYQLRRQHQREPIVPVEDPSREANLRRKRERLEAREEVLEEHNYQLQVQLHRLRILLQQDEAMQLSSPEKPSVHPSSKPYRTASPSVATIASPYTGSEPNNTMISSEVNFSGGINQPPSVPGVLPTHSSSQHSSVPQATFLTSSPSMQLNSPRYSLSLGHPYQKPQFGEFQRSLASNPFLPKTAAELGVAGRSVISREGIELSNIVDRITSTFPLDAHSDLPVDIHNDIFLAASIIGEAMQCMVTEMSRNTESEKAGLEAGRILTRENGGTDCGGKETFPGEGCPAGDSYKRFSMHSASGSD